MTKVLILYGTRYGSTEEISQKIASILEKHGLTTELLNLKNTDKHKTPQLSDFDGIILGSSIQIGKWTKSMKNFVEINQGVLKNFDKPFAMFVSCATAMKPEDIPKAKKEYIQDFLSPKGISPKLYDAFGGVLDLTNTSNIGYLAKKMLKMAMKNDPNLDVNGKNDFRDWKQIETFAETFAQLFNV